jgi:hypothetical protein
MILAETIGTSILLLMALFVAVRVLIEEIKEEIEDRG